MYHILGSMRRLLLGALASAGRGAYNILDRPVLTSSWAPLLTARFARSQAFVDA